MDGSSDIIFLNGAYLPKAEASVSVEDRGTLFGDGVYEVLRYINGKPFEMVRHTARLERSLGGIDLHGVDPHAVAEASDKVVRRNGLTDAKVYWQVTRGSGPRNHLIENGLSPSVLVIAYPMPKFDADAPIKQYRVRTTEDNRWGDCWIKSIMLLPNTLAKSQAVADGFDDAVYLRDGVITETTAGNFFLVRGGELWTHPANRHILNGITRQVVLELATADGIKVYEQPFGEDAIALADEAVLTSTTNDAAAITHIDGTPVGSGGIGPVTQRLSGLFRERVQQECAAG